MLVLCFMAATWSCIPMPSGFAYDLDAKTVRWTGAAPRPVGRVLFDFRSGTVTLDDPLIFRAGFE